MGTPKEWRFLPDHRKRKAISSKRILPARGWNTLALVSLLLVLLTDVAGAGVRASLLRWVHEAPFAILPPGKAKTPETSTKDKVAEKVDRKSLPIKLSKFEVSPINSAANYCANVIVNSEFNVSSSNWALYNETGNTSTLNIDATSQLSGINSGRVTISTASGTDWHIQLRQANKTVEAGRVYRLTFQARAAANRNVTVYLQAASSPYPVYATQVVAITTSKQTYTADFVVNQSNDLNVVLCFGLGATTTKTWIDNVVLAENCDASACVGGGFGNRTRNPEFNAGTAQWNLNLQPANAAVLSIDNTSKLSGVNSAYVNITQASGTIWHIQMDQSGYVVQAGRKYLLTFKARATSARNMYVSLQQYHTPYVEHAGETVSLTTSAKSYSIVYTPPTTDETDTGLKFHLAAKTGGVWIDDVVFTEVCNAGTFNETVEICGNGIDDDGDGLIDNADSECAGCTAATYGFQSWIHESGPALRPGSVYRFPGAVEGVDVRLRIGNFSHSDIVIRDIDKPANLSGGYNLAFQPEVDYDWGNDDATLDPLGERYIDFTFDFYEAGTTIRKNFAELVVAAIDVDGDDQCLREFIQTKEFSGYTLGSPTNLQLSGALQAKSTIANATNIDETSLPHIISFTYQSNSTISIRYGAEAMANCVLPMADTRLNSLYFKCYTLPVEVLCPTLYVSGAPSLCLGQPVTLRASRGGFSGSCTYQWQRSVNGVTWSDVAGATTLNYVISNLTTDTYFRIGMPCTGNATCGTVYSASFLVDVVDCGEICDNGIDDDGDGTTDCSDPDCQGASVGASMIMQAVGVDDFGNVLGGPDGAFAEVYDFADSLTLAFSNTIAIGGKYSLVWRRRRAPYDFGTSVVRIYASTNGVSWTQHPIKPTVTNQSSFQTFQLTANVATRFLRIRHDDGTDDDFELDAVTYVSSCPVEICDNGIDDDGDGLIDGEDPDCCGGSSLVPRANMSVYSVSSQELNNQVAPATNAFDGNPATFWHTEWVNLLAPMPHQLTLDLGSARNVTGFRYLPRQDEPNGRIATYEIYVSNNPASWGAAVKTGSFLDGYSEKTVRFGISRGRYVRLRILSEVAANAFASIAELNILQCDSRLPEVCANGVDDDGDGLTDCDDPACPSALVVPRVMH